MPYLWKVFRTLLPIISNFATIITEQPFLYKITVLMTHCHLFIPYINESYPLCRHRRDTRAQQKQGRGQRKSFLVNVATH